MIAFKTYRQCPNRPIDIGLDWPWQVQEIAPGAATLDLKNDGFQIVSQEDYDNYVLQFSTQIEYYNSQQTNRLVKHSILIPAKDFGIELINSFATENILLGITAHNMTNTVRKNAAQIISALSTGSLYDAIDEARAIPLEHKDATFLTDARLLIMINKIETYFQLELSTSL